MYIFMTILDHRVGKMKYFFTANKVQGVVKMIINEVK